MSEPIDLGPWPVPVHDPALNGYRLTLHIEQLPESAGVRVVLEARAGRDGVEGGERYFKVVEEQPYEAILMRDGTTAFYQVRNRLVDRMVEVIAEYDKANPLPVVES
jgi:hypothetical protein